MDKLYDLVIIGGGIVGLAAAMEAVHRFPHARLLVLEKEARIAAHQTGHNSGVIHSGIYYKPGSEKARTCVQGAAEMVAFCQNHNVPYKICGKVVVATDEAELGGLQELLQRGGANGVAGLRLVGPEELRELEPHCAGIRALHVPTTGITDYSLVAREYARIVRQAGGSIRTGVKVTGLRRTPSAILVETTLEEVQTRYLINCGGLHSDAIARMADSDSKYQIVPFRGEYYDLVPEKHYLVKGLIYPVADPRFPFLGVHFTRRVGGGVEAGPNAVLALKREGYRKRDISIVDSARLACFPGFRRMVWKYWRSGLGEFYHSVSKPAFVRALQKLVPELKPSDVRPGGAGVRAQALDRKGNLVDDFRFIFGERMVHVCNVPSPAATASIVIGRHIIRTLARSADLGGQTKNGRAH